MTVKLESEEDWACSGGKKKEYKTAETKKGGWKRDTMKRFEGEMEQVMKGLGVLERTFCNILLVQRNWEMSVKSGTEDRRDLRRNKVKMQWRESMGAWGE